MRSPFQINCGLRTEFTAKQLNRRFVSVNRTATQTVAPSKFRASVMMEKKKAEEERTEASN
jgi:hypothetical protein